MEITFDAFKPLNDGTAPVRARGYAVGAGSSAYANLNWANIQNRMVRLAGTLVKSYAGDIFAEYEKISREIDTFCKNSKADSYLTAAYEPKHISFLLGFRELGVDSATQIFVKYELPKVYSNENGEAYSEIWRLDFDGTEDGSITMSFYKVNKELDR